RSRGRCALRLGKRLEPRTDDRHPRRSVPSPEHHLGHHQTAETEFGVGSILTVRVGAERQRGECHQSAAGNLYLIANNGAGSELLPPRAGLGETTLAHRLDLGDTAPAHEAVAAVQPGECVLGRQQLQQRSGVVDGLTACEDRKSTRLNSSHVSISYAVFCLKKKNNE